MLYITEKIFTLQKIPIIQNFFVLLQTIHYEGCF